MDMSTTEANRDADVFDRSLLLRHCMEDLALAHNLLELYLTDLTPRAIALHAALSAGDRAALQQVAHAIRGSSLTVGALGLAALTQDIESACRQGELPGVAGVWPEWERTLTATRDAMQRMQGEPHPD